MKLNPEMRPCSKVKTHKSKILYQHVPDASSTHWCGGCEAGKRNPLHNVGSKEFKPPENCCHSNYRYLHQKLLSIVL